MMRRPFKKLRRRRTAKERRKLLLFWRMAQLLIVLGALGAGGYTLYQYLTESERFKIATIRIIGAEILDENDILLTTGITAEDTMLTVDAGEVKNRILEIPRIKTCVVQRQMPDTIVIEITERKTIAAIMINNRLYEVDEEGVVLREIDSLAPHPGPMITSLPDLNFAQAGQQISQKELHMAIALWRAFSQKPVSQQITVSELAAQSTEHISMICDELPFEIRWGYTDVTQQADKLNTLWNAQKGVFPCQEYLDLRFGADIPCR